MSIKYTLETVGHPSIYNPQSRKLLIEFEVPSSIVANNAPGIIILIPGYGGNIYSNVYKKMRNVFADENNFITVQCNYFGSEFMQKEVLKETIAYFNEMGPIQAMDNLIALKCVKDYCDENEIQYNSKIVVAYGHSHGAYLAHLMNVLMPEVLSCIIDNSGWLFPDHINKSRYLYRVSETGDPVLVAQIDYLIKNIIMDREIYNLRIMYPKINETRIISFHGVDDTLISVNDKVNFLCGVRNTSIELIGKSRIDNKIFNSSTHGLGADFLELFRYVLRNYKLESQNTVLKFRDRIFETQYASYKIDNEDGIPILYCTPKYDYQYDKLAEYDN